VDRKYAHTVPFADAAERERRIASSGGQAHSPMTAEVVRQRLERHEPAETEAISGERFIVPARKARDGFK
jgi:hypothetical protein